MNLDLYYSPEVEEALVTLVWHKPDLLPYILRKINPATHILQEHLRFILEAVQLSQDLLSQTDFATVAEALREEGRLEACGDLIGLEAIYSRNWGYESLLDYYIELLKLYAAKRQNRDPAQVVIFSGGKATIGLNKDKDKANPKAPDYAGTALVRGRKYKVLGWIGQDKELIHCSFYAS